MQSGIIVAHASSEPSGMFAARSRAVDLTGDNFSVTNTPAITVLTHGLGGSASHWSNNNNNIAAAIKASNSTVYNEFKKMLIDIAHDFGHLTGGIYPKINLIGFSRGGLTRACGH